MNEVEDNDVFSPIMEIECDKCKKPVLMIQLTPSVVNFDVTCHRCGIKMEGTNFSHSKVRSNNVIDENMKRWQDKNK